MVEQPTQEQIKEFWEGYGFELRETTEQVCGVVKKCYKWKYPNGSWHDFLPDLTGIEALGNLFKYAVPKLIEDVSYGRLRVNVHELLVKWIDEVVWQRGDPALPLFWALWKVKNEVIRETINPMVLKGERWQHNG